MNVNPIYKDVVCDNRGPYLHKATLVVTGLTPSAANTIPHGLPTTPRHVMLQSIANAALGALATLDDSQGIADPTGTLAGGKLGFDATNVYVYVGADTELLVHIEY
jgi:hypothetical protein